MVFDRKVEVGRVVNITYGPDFGKLAVIVEIIDHGRVLVDGPTTGVKRQPISFKRATLTAIKVKIPRSVGTASLKPMLEKQDLNGLWEKTSWAKKIAQRAARKETDDFGRFKIMLARKKKSAIVGKAFKKQRKAQ